MQPQLKQNPPNNTAFVLGNGRSRLAVALQPLSKLGSIYGCNALYREFAPDALVAVDVKMVNEIISSGYNRDHEVWTNPNKGIISKDHLNIFNPHKGWSSGPTALWLACSRGHRDIYILGFDYQGLGGKLNNVYADTFNYKKSTDVATFYGNWLNQTERVVQEFRSTRFHRVIEKGNIIPDKLGAMPNVEHLTVEDFQKKFPETIYADQTNQKSVI